MSDQQIRLAEVAHGRSGDKGNHANVAILAYTPEGFRWLREQLTNSVVAAFFNGLGVTRVVRFEAEKLQAFNFVLENALGGGASRSLHTDTQGKSFALTLLQLELPRPSNWAQMIRKQKESNS
ncbi:hypothetical protein BH10PLA2_BH10PLA2_25520 [soil metagenome]